jgi:methyl-accepting chemotaxis protein
VDSETHEAQQAVSLGDEAAASTKLITLSGMTAGFLAALGLGIALALSISRPLRRVIAGLTDSADQVAAASSQVSSSSQMLAEGASEQAAALEETSSSMEEMSSMTRQNAENAAQADSLMREANRVASHAQESMTHLTTSMGEINRASEETQKIIKTIDEIAFQTNLLALNAAVEAARAGEAGAGFAVVADEVRNLAMRAAEAAKNTATLIDGTVKRIGEGSKMVQKTNDEFNTVARSMTKAGELVGEISAASQEQAQGIDQVTRAISEMDKVVQQNASGAEESAAASEEMNAQAEHMKTFVGELENLVGGRKSQEVAGPAIQPEKRGWKGVPANSKPGVNKAASINYPRPKPNGNGKALPAIKSERRNSRAEQLIPMREEDFSDF